MHRHVCKSGVHIESWHTVMLNPANISWTRVMSNNFEIQWKALKPKKDEDTSEVPKITHALPVIRWTEVFQGFPR